MSYNVGYFNSAFAPAGNYADNVSINGSPMYPAQLPSEIGVTVYPTFPAPGQGSKPTNQTGNETAIVSYRIPIDRAAIMVAHEALFSYPYPRLLGPYHGDRMKDGEITSLSMLNMKLRDDWNEIKRLATGKDAVATYAQEYLAQGESWFHAEGKDEIYGWKRFARVMNDPKLAAFRTVSKYGLARINFLGVTITTRDVNVKNPLGIVSATVAGPLKIRNYWGKEPQTGSILGFIFRKEKNGPYQIIPWSTKNDAMPEPRLCTYEDCAGRLQYSRVIRVARMTHRNPSRGGLDVSQIAAGLSSATQDLTELSTRIAYLDTVDATLMTSSRFFI